MTTMLPSDLRDIAKYLRIIAILDAAERVGMTPMPVAPIHTVAYFAEVLAPVWHLTVLDGQILKRRQPYYPSLQADIDRLVGVGVVVVEELGPDMDVWPIASSYSLNRDFAGPILDAASRFRTRARDIEFVREVMFATSGLGFDGLNSASHADATYGDPLVDLGGLIEVEPADGQNPTSAAALQFRQLLDGGHDLSDAEVINLYVRHLYSRLRVA